MLSSPIRCREFVGRTVELDHVIARRRDASELRGGGAVLIAGEAGIGKTRLIDEFVAASARSTSRVVRTECREFAQSPIGPLADILDRLGEPTAFLRESISEEAQVAQLLEIFTRVCERRTTVIVIEDLHWASRELVQIVWLLTRAARAQRALFLITYRDDEIIGGHPVFIPLGKLAREPGVSAVRLERLERDQIFDLLAKALGRERTVPHLTLADVAKRSDGNPLYGEELLRHAVDGLGDPAATGPRSVPITLEAIVRERIERCSPRERSALEFAALFGRDFGIDELREIAGEPKPSAAELAALVESQLLQPVEGDRFAFRHALTRDVMYAGIAPAVARPLHRTIARALASRPPGSVSIVEVAHHEWHGGDLAEAGAPCAAAGDLAVAQFAYDDGIRWYERAIRAYGVDSPAGFAVRMSLGRALVATHDLARGFEEYERVVAWARTHDVALFVRARRLIAGVMANDGRQFTAIGLLEATLDELDPGAQAPLATALGLRITSYLLMREDPAEARDSLVRFDPERLEPASQAEYYLLRSAIYAREPHGEAAWRADSERALAIYAELGAPIFEHYSHVQFALQALALGDLASARTALEAATARSTASASSNNHLPLSYASLELAAARYGEARRWLARAHPETLLFSRAMTALVRIELAVALDDPAEIEAALVPGIFEELERAEDYGSALRLGAAAASALIRLGRRPEADRLLERVVPRVRSTFGHIPAILTIAAIRPDLAESFTGALEASATPFSRAALALVRAECATQAASEPDAEALATALLFFERAGWQILAARSLELAGDRATASQRYREAGNLAGIRRLGLSAFQSPERIAATIGSDDALTSRERAVVELVLAGNSNREVAERLSISGKTVEKYLTSVYGKLGVQSRAQLTAVVAKARGAIS